MRARVHSSAASCITETAESIETHVSEMGDNRDALRVYGFGLKMQVILYEGEINLYMQTIVIRRVRSGSCEREVFVCGFTTGRLLVECELIVLRPLSQCTCMF